MIVEKKRKFYKIKDTAEFIGVHPDTLRNLEKRGLIKPLRLGRRRDRLYTQGDIIRIKKILAIEKTKIKIVSNKCKRCGADIPSRKQFCKKCLKTRKKNRNKKWSKQQKKIITLKQKVKNLEVIIAKYEKD